MELRIRTIFFAAVLALVGAACGSDAATSPANAVPATAPEDATVETGPGSSTTDTSTTIEASAATDTSATTETSATTATTAAPASSDPPAASQDDDRRKDEGGSISITAEDIEAAAGWIDVSAKTYAPCDVVDDETFLVEVFNEGDEIADYELSVVFFQADGGENEAAAGTELIPSLRPGERAVQEGWSPFDGTGESCIVTTIRRAVTQGDNPEPGDRCTVFGVAESGSVDFQVEIVGTHDGEVWPMVAFVDADGVRRATHEGLIEELATGEVGTVADTNISGVDDPTVVGCAVVSRINF